MPEQTVPCHSFLSFDFCYSPFHHLFVCSLFAHHFCYGSFDCRKFYGRTIDIYSWSPVVSLISAKSESHHSYVHSIISMEQFILIDDDWNIAFLRLCAVLNLAREGLDSSPSPGWFTFDITRNNFFRELPLSRLQIPACVLLDSLR